MVESRPATIKVEVAYAEPARQFLRACDVPSDARVRDAIEASGVLSAFPTIDLASHRVGVWNRAVPLDTPLRSGDRVEIYRPLQVDPKEVRRQRAVREPVKKKS